MIISKPKLKFKILFLKTFRKEMTHVFTVTSKSWFCLFVTFPNK